MQGLAQGQRYIITARRCLQWWCQRIAHVYIKHTKFQTAEKC